MGAWITHRRAGNGHLVRAPAAIRSSAPAASSAVVGRAVRLPANHLIHAIAVYSMRVTVSLPLLVVVTVCACSGDVNRPDKYFPECEIVSPAGGSAFTFGDSVIVIVNAGDPDGEVTSVTFYDNDTAQAVDTEPPFSYVLSNLAYRIGDHSLKAVATDNDGLQSHDDVEISITSNQTPVYRAIVKNSYAHDTKAFTQGLVFDGGYLYEGTGIWGQSSVRRVELETGEVLASRETPNRDFGEGIAIWDEKIYQLTYKSGIGYIYGKAALDSLSSFTYDTEGWGLTSDSEHLIMSDGTSSIYIRDPGTFESVGRIVVTDRGSPVTQLNELEYIAGDLFANVWREDRIARISLDTGEVVGWIDLEDVSEPFGGVLNGIAYDQAGGRLFITGKNWDTLYEIELGF